MKIKLAAYSAPTKMVEVGDFAQASAAFCSYRDENGFGASAMKRGCGDVRDHLHRLVARVGYNGRVWNKTYTQVYYEALLLDNGTGLRAEVLSSTKAIIDL